MSETRHGFLPWRTALGVTLGFVLLVLFFTRRSGQALEYAAGVLLGPFAGGVAREWQSCCAESSWGLFPYGLAGLVVGVVALVAIRPRSVLRARARATIFGLGWAFWLTTGIFSYLHALE